VAFRATDGTLLWTADSGQPVTGSPTVANRVVYYGAGANILAADAGSRATLWSQSTTSTVKNSPMVVNGRLFFTTDDGALHAYHLQARSALARYSHRRPGGSRAVRGSAKPVGIRRCPATVRPPRGTSQVAYPRADGSVLG
jgi:outer membrane protein assembly factor BamB